MTGGEHAGDAAFMHSQAEVENSMAILGKKKSQHTEREKSQYTEEKSQYMHCQRWKTAWRF